MAAAEKKEPESLYVTAALVEVDVKGGKRQRLYRGDLVTEAVMGDSVEHLKSLGFVSTDQPQVLNVDVDPVD